MSASRTRRSTCAGGSPTTSRWSSSTTAALTGPVRSPTSWRPGIRRCGSSTKAGTGYGTAVRTGLAASTKDWICLTDGDDEYDLYDWRVVAPPPPLRPDHHLPLRPAVLGDPHPDLLDLQLGAPPPLLHTVPRTSARVCAWSGGRSSRSWTSRRAARSSVPRSPSRRCSWATRSARSASRRSPATSVGASRRRRGTSGTIIDMLTAAGNSTVLPIVRSGRRPIVRSGRRPIVRSGRRPIVRALTGSNWPVPGCAGTSAGYCAACASSGRVVHRLAGHRVGGGHPDPQVVGGFEPTSHNHRVIPLNAHLGSRTRRVTSGGMSSPQYRR